MTALKIENFGGELPSVSARALPPAASPSQSSRRCWGWRALRWLRGWSRGPEIIAAWRPDEFVKNPAEIPRATRKPLIFKP